MSVDDVEVAPDAFIRTCTSPRARALTLKLVGMKRLDLHGTVVAGSPHTYQRAHRLATRHRPGGQPWI